MYPIQATVKSVDEAEGTIVAEPLQSENPEIYDVRISATLTPTLGLRVIPKVGSVVFVVMINRETGIVILASELEKILIDTDLVTFNGGANAGLVNVADLVTQLNAIENKVNAFIALYNAHVHAALGTPTVSLVVGTLANTLQNQIEDTKVKH